MRTQSLLLSVPWICLCSPAAAAQETDEVLVASSATPSGTSSPAPCANDPFAEGLYTQFELHLSLLSEASERSTLDQSYGYAPKLGYRWGDWGLFAQVEHNIWGTQEFEDTLRSGVLNAGLGVEFLYFDRRVRSSLAFGPSVLLFDTALDETGHTGIFADLRPAGLRWRLHEHVVVQLDPISFTLAAPVLEKIPLVNIQYRAVLGFEFGLWRSGGEG